MAPMRGPTSVLPRAQHTRFIRRGERQLVATSGEGRSIVWTMPRAVLGAVASEKVPDSGVGSRRRLEKQCRDGESNKIGPLRRSRSGEGG